MAHLLSEHIPRISQELIAVRRSVQQLFADEKISQLAWDFSYQLAGIILAGRNMPDAPSLLQLIKREVFSFQHPRDFSVASAIHNFLPPATDLAQMQANLAGSIFKNAEHFPILTRSFLYLARCPETGASDKILLQKSGLYALISFIDSVRDDSFFRQVKSIINGSDTEPDSETSKLDFHSDMITSRPALEAGDVVKALKAVKLTEDTRLKSELANFIQAGETTGLFGNIHQLAEKLRANRPNLCAIHTGCIGR